MHHQYTSLANVDLRLLRVFATVIKCGGFSAAQGELGMNQVTISIHMRNLEERLGMRLCERGRSGFGLTEEGMSIQKAMDELFGSIEKFKNSVADIQGDLTGNITFATVDAMISNPSFSLQTVIRKFRLIAPKVHLKFNVESPQALVQGLFSGNYDVILIPKVDNLPKFQSAHIFKEIQKLYCAEGHPLYGVADESIAIKDIESQPFAGRSYMQEKKLCGLNLLWSASTPHMEGTLILISSGAYIGFLPDHYAESFSLSKLKPIHPKTLTFNDSFLVATQTSQPSRSANILYKLILEQK